MSIVNRLRPGLLLAAVAALLTGLAPALAAQNNGSIRGRVLESGSRRPLGGVQVLVVGTNRGALTGAGGEFTISDVAAGSYRLRASLLGYGTAEGAVTVSAGQAAQADLTLSPSAVSLDEIVVTGTPGGAARRTLGNAVTSVNAAEVTRKATITNVTELLQSRTPGVQVLMNSGVAGTASEIRIRGAGSLINNAPVIFVDGVRYNTSAYGTFSPSGAGATGFTGQTTNALEGLDPNDIESVEVIKGPAAATLYGAEAANGVIQIITKKGHSGQQNLQWNARADFGQNEWALEIPNNYTYCDQTKLNDPATWPGCAGKPAGTVLTQNPLRDDPIALRSGALKRQTLSLRGGGDRYSFYVSGDNSEEQGVFYNNYDNRRSVRANIVFRPTGKFDFNINTNYIRSRIRLPVGDESAQGMLLSAFRGKPGRVPPGNNPRSDGWSSTNPEQANSYNNHTRVDRITLGSTANYSPFSWFRNRLTVGLDYTSSLGEILSYPGSTDADYAGTPEGFVAQRIPRDYYYTVDYAGNVEKAFSDALRSTTSFGMQLNTKHRETLYASGRGLGAPTVTQIDRAAVTTGANSWSDSKSLGFFGQEQLGWQDRLFVTGAVRMDNSSVFGSAIRRIFYPKASLSWVLSEEPALAGLFDAARVESFKLRSAWGQAGQAPPPYVAAQTYTVGQVVLGTGNTAVVGSELRTLAYGNEGLKPERGVELEAGFDAGAFGDRVGLEFTYYNKQMHDVLVTQAIPASTGWVSSPYTNLGTTRNTGIEVGLSLVPVQQRLLTWESRVNLATNHNELVSFGDPNLTRISVSGASYTPGYQQHRAGYPLAGWWLQEVQRNPDGTPVLTGSATNPSVALDTATFQGTAIPTREIGFSNTFTLFRDFRVFALIDYKGGHKVFNYKERNRCSTSNNNCERLTDPANINLATGAVVNPEVYVWRQAPIAFLENGDFAKLRDLSLTYTVPSSYARRMRASSASVTLAGHNLALWSGYSGIDPEVNGYGNRDFVRADVFAVPMIRRVTLSLNLGF